MRDSDSGECVKPQGTYSDSVMATSCTSCPEGLTTAEEGANEASLCFGKKFTVFYGFSHIFI